MEEWFSLIRNFGFPVVMVGWFAFRMEGIMLKLTESNNNLAGAIQSLREGLKK